jgi:putative endopeptidase
VLAKPDAKLDVSMPSFVRQVNALVESQPLEDWMAYLTAHVTSNAAPWLSQAFFDESFRFTSKLTGAQAPLPRWKRSAAAVDNGMGEALGKAYVAMMFPPSSKAKMLEMVNNLQATLREHILSREWMDKSTKQAAVKKLDKVLKKIGYPDTWRDYTALAIDADAPGITNLMHARQFEAERENQQVGKPVDRAEWGMTPPTVNAYYNPLINEIVFPAGILMPPQFDPKAPDAVNYGAIGMVIGHEMTHGFDDEGRQYDADGNLKDWWTADDSKKFDARADKVVQQYNGFVAVDTLHVNGKLTLGENLADLGGITIAYYAFERSMKGKPRTTIEGFTPEQLFFLGCAQGWRRKLRPEVDRLRTLTDPHSPAQFRVNGPLSNFPEFAKAFGCKTGNPMVRDDSVRAEIW